MTTGPAGARRCLRAARFAAGWSWLAVFVAGCTTYPDPPEITDVPDATEEPNEPEDADDGATIVDDDVGSQGDAGLDGDAYQRDASDARARDAARDADGRANLDAGDGRASDASDEDSARGPSDAGDAGEDVEAGDAGEYVEAGEPPRCDDGVKNGSETDLDCGGPCGPCELDKECNLASDCVTGFCCGGPYCSPSICALASGPPFWLSGSGPPLSQPRSSHAAALRPLGPARGSILVIEGVNSQTSSNLTSYETLDSQTASWTVASLPNPNPNSTVLSAAGTAPDGKVFLFSGSAIPTRMYDGNWTTSLAPAPANCNSRFAAALGSDGLFYVVCMPDVTSNVVHTYDPVRNVWSSVMQPKPTAMLSQQGPVDATLAAVSVGSKVFVLGGAALPGVLEAFDTATNTWSKHARLPDRFAGPAVMGPDGRIYAIGGTVGNSQTSIETDGVTAYQLSADRWAPVRALKTPRYSHAVVQGADGRIYALGGLSGGGSIASVEVYGPLVSITPSTASAGTNVVVTGDNFAANAGVRVYLGTTQGPLLATGRTSSGGAIAPQIVFSSPAQSSEGFVTIVDDKSRFPIRLPFAVN